ncbi:nuclear protein SNF4 [Microsporum canis CBS 113480]|uniref:Nuclear protein SNF4 n=1 Tax=Arthroderma otae (strain ATCC MYA-4605 / CBS 113480) TaxID=554155 RepID=C5FQU5_ARTOC|nr:nuclear protein SNF4 [Microsporum canis CBS 113480]EEQ32248.1 nuclear protein SNF4 [Microsporum canis CBS 113480]
MEDSLSRQYSNPTQHSNSPTSNSGSSHAHSRSKGSHEAPFVQPSSYLRPQGYSRPTTPTLREKIVDDDERQALLQTRGNFQSQLEVALLGYIFYISGSERRVRAIRDFLKVRTSYDVLPLSFRLIVFDTSLSVKESLNILIQNDYINVIQYYFQHQEALAKIDQFRLNSLREVERALGVAPPETISIGPERPLYEACRSMLSSRARRVPLVSYDSQTERPLVVSVLTQYRLLKFVAVNVAETQKLRKPLKEINLGTYTDIVTASMDTPVIDVIHKLVERSISSVPIVNSEAVDVITLIKGGVYDDLNLEVGEVLKKRSPDFPGIYTCSVEDGLDTILDTIRRSRVHRLVVVDDHFRLRGVLALSDILHYLLLEGEQDEP